MMAARQGSGGAFGVAVRGSDAAEGRFQFGDEVVEEGGHGREAADDDAGGDFGDSRGR